MTQIELHHEAIKLIYTIDRLEQEIRTHGNYLMNHAGTDTDYLKTVADTLETIQSERCLFIDKYNGILEAIKMMNYEI